MYSGGANGVALHAMIPFFDDATNGKIAFGVLSSLVGLAIVLRGGYRWRVAVPAGQNKRLRAGYEVKIANKLELVGGNRRES